MATKRDAIGWSALGLGLVVCVGGAIAMNWNKVFPNGRVIRAETDLRAIAEALELYRGEHDGRLPASLAVLLDGKRSLCQEAVPLDPWDHEYSYSSRDDGTFDLVCLGADGQRGGTGDDADIAWTPALSARLAQGRPR